MGKTLPGLLFSFVSQKGGSGKTTLTTMYANYLQKASERTHLEIAVVDCDNKQQSIMNRRSFELQQNPDAKGLYDVYAINSSDFASRAEELKNKYDIILIDLPGNMEQEGVLSLYYMLDVAVIPMIPSIIDFDATMEFCKKFKEIQTVKQKKFNIETTFAGLFNKVKVMESEFKDIYDQRENLFIPFLDNFIKDEVGNRRGFTTLNGKITYEQRKAFDEVTNLITTHIKKLNNY